MKSKIKKKKYNPTQELWGVINGEVKPELGKIYHELSVHKAQANADGSNLVMQLKELSEMNDSIMATFAALKQREDGRNSEFTNLSTRIDDISNKLTTKLHNLDGGIDAFNERLLEMQKEKQTEDDFAFRQASLDKMFRRVNKSNGDIFRKLGKLEAEMQAQHIFNNKIPHLIQHQMDGHKVLKLSNWLNYQNAFCASVGVIVALLVVLCLK